jgi:hypothetical protein
MDFEVFYGSRDSESSDRLSGSNVQSIFRTARALLFKSNVGPRHLAIMTFGDDFAPSEEELEQRIREIKLYLSLHPPIVRVLVIPKSYGITPDPSTLPQYKNHQGPWLAKSTQQRRSLTVEIYIHSAIYELHKRSTRKQ